MLASYAVPFSATSAFLCVFLTFIPRRKLGNLGSLLSNNTTFDDLGHPETQTCTCILLLSIFYYFCMEFRVDPCIISLAHTCIPVLSR